MADRSTSRPARRRRPHVPFHRGLSFKLALLEFNSRVQAVAPVQSYVDEHGRTRHVGRAAQKNAFWALKTIYDLQRSPKTGVKYIGYTGLGAAMRCSRSTAYRAITLLLLADLLILFHDGTDWLPGGKIHDEWGRLHNRANGYMLHPDLHRPAERQVRKPKAGKPGLGPQGQQRKPLGAIWEEQARSSVATRAGPAA